NCEGADVNTRPSSSSQYLFLLHRLEVERLREQRVVFIERLECVRFYGADAIHYGLGNRASTPFDPGTLPDGSQTHASSSDAVGRPIAQHLPHVWHALLT